MKEDGRPPAPITYLLPLRWREPGPIDELARYLAGLRAACPDLEEILVVDGSPEPLYSAHAAVLGDHATHIRPDSGLSTPMGKVGGVITGVRAARNERIVITDDDVRYREPELKRAAALLDAADLVRPQNYFDHLPWHSHWDTARSLLNRVCTGDRDFPVGDFPGTLAVRRQSFLDSGAYDGRALFENLELMRTVLAWGGEIATPLDLYVARQPPTAEHFLGQRVRQAYDDFAMPARIAALLSLMPTVAWLAWQRRWRTLGLGAAVSVAAAEVGRRRAGGRAYFPASASLCAPLWLIERGICTWLALYARLRGGVAYGEPASAWRQIQLALFAALGLEADSACGCRRVCDRPQRQSATTPVRGSIVFPSWSVMTKESRTRYGPFL